MLKCGLIIISPYGAQNVPSWRSRRVERLGAIPKPEDLKNRKVDGCLSSAVFETAGWTGKNNWSFGSIQREEIPQDCSRRLKSFLSLGSSAAFSRVDLQLTDE